MSLVNWFQRTAIKEFSTKGDCVKHADVVWNGKERVWEASSPIDGTQVVALSREGLVDRLKVLEHQKIVADTVRRKTSRK